MLESILTVVLAIALIVLIFKVTTKLLKLVLGILLLGTLAWFVYGLLSGLGIWGALVSIPVIGGFFG